MALARVSQLPHYCPVGPEDALCRALCPEQHPWLHPPGALDISRNRHQVLTIENVSGMSKCPSGAKPPA